MQVKQLTAGQLMTKHLITVEPQAPLSAAIKLLADHHIHCLIVLPSEAGACSGIVTIKDIVQVLCDGDQQLLDQLAVADVMSAPAFTVQQDFLVGDCIRLMRIAGVRSAPVLNGTKLVGLLSFTDVLVALSKQTAS